MSTESFLHNSVQASAGPVYFKHNYVGQLAMDTVVVEETINLAEDFDAKPSKIKIDLDEQIQITESVDPKPSKWKLPIDENINLEESVDYGVEILNIDESINLTDSAHVAGAIHYPSDLKIYNDKIYLVTNTNPIRIGIIDTSLETIEPSVTILNQSGDDYANAQDFVLNKTFDVGYIACKAGKICEFDLDNTSNRSLIDLDTEEDLLKIDCLDDFKYTYTSTNALYGVLYQFDDTLKTAINTRFSFLKGFRELLQASLSWLHGKVINTDFRFLVTQRRIINTDFRFTPEPVGVVQPKGIDNLVIKLDGLDISDEVILTSVSIHKNEEDGLQSCTFTLPRHHDNIDYSVAGDHRQITDQNEIEVLFDNRQLFIGKIKRIEGSGREESVGVYAERVVSVERTQVFDSGTTPTFVQGHTHTISDNDDGIHRIIHYLVLNNNEVREAYNSARSVRLRLTEQEKQRHWLDVITLDNLLIENPDEDPYTTYPEFPRGVIADLGEGVQHVTYQQQGIFTLRTENALGQHYNRVSIGAPQRRYLDVAAGQWVTDDTPTYWGTSPSWGYLKDLETFQPRQGWTHFFFVKRARVFRNIGDVFSSEIITDKYIGTSPAQLSNDLCLIDFLSYRIQRDGGIRRTQLGSYKIGEAPYLKITPPNGRLSYNRRWEDRSDGMYDVVPTGGFDNTQHVKDMVHLEYEKLKNINGDILPRTSVDISIGIDSFLYNNIKLLNRINIENTKQSGIYNRANGFPVAVKSITIDFSNLSVILGCDNSLSRKEMLQLEAQAPEPPEPSRGMQMRITRKFDIVNLRYTV